MSSAEELKAKGNKALQSGNVKEWYTDTKISIVE